MAKKFLCAVGIALALASSSKADGFDPQNGLIFYAPLNGKYEALKANGQKTPLVQKNTSFVEGKFGQGALLKDNAQLYYSGKENFNINEGSAAFWVKRNEKWSNKRAFIIFKSIAGKGWNQSSIYFSVTNWNELSLKVFDDAKKSSQSMSQNNVPYRANEWLHLAITFKDGSLRIFVNGKEISYKTKCDPMMDMPTGLSKYIQFGSDYTPKAVFDGVMDELRIYNRVLSPEEIASLYLYKPETE